jgi:hypothetical protein
MRKLLLFVSIILITIGQSFFPAVAQKTARKVGAPFVLRLGRELPPEFAKHKKCLCFVFDSDDYYNATGIRSKYGGMVCTFYY